MGTIQRPLPAHRLQRAPAHPDPLRHRSRNLPDPRPQIHRTRQPRASVACIQYQLRPRRDYMTTDQRTKLMAYWWPDAARAQGWDATDRVKRLEVFSAAVGRPLASASELNSTTDIDAVKAHLLA